MQEHWGQNVRKVHQGLNTIGRDGLGQYGPWLIIGIGFGAAGIPSDCEGDSCSPDNCRIPKLFISHMCTIGAKTHRSLEGCPALQQK